MFKFLGLGFLFRFSVFELGFRVYSYSLRFRV